MTSEADIMENLRAMREEEEDKKRRQRVRDWDVGKEGVETSRQGCDTFLPEGFRLGIQIVLG